MNVNNINPYQGLQNAFRPDVGNASTADNRQGSSVSQRQSDVAVVHDPPFFPIATYQRQDLIKKVQAVEAGLGKNATNAVRTETSENIQPGEILTIKI